MDGKIKALLIALMLLYPYMIVGVGQDCDIPGNGSFIFPKKGCAPLDVNYKVEFQGIAGGASADVKILFDWDDGSPTELVTPTYDAGNDMWSVTVPHTYSVRDPECIYVATGIPVINGTVCDAATAVQKQNVTVWDSDFYSSSGLVVAPYEYRICYGNTGSVVFEDVSVWNCEPPEIPVEEGANDRKRWIQWIYGTNSGDLQFIDDIKVNGVTPGVFPMVGAIEQTSEPIFNPTPPWSESLPIAVTSIHDVGKRFRITLRNWNQCNPYDDPDIPGPPVDLENGDNDPVETDAWVVIVAPPDGTVNAAGPFCENNGFVSLTAVTPGGTWSGIGIVPATNQFDPSVAGPGFHVVNYDVTDGNGCAASGSTTIEVKESPVADITEGAAAYLCPGTSLPLDGNPSMGQVPYVHLWKGDVVPLDVTNNQTPTFETITEGSYELVYRVTDTNGCFDEDTVVVEVDSVDIGFINKHLNVCSGIDQVLEPTPNGGSGIYASHTWSGTHAHLLSDTDVEKPVFNSATAGLFKFEYTVRDTYGCEDSDSVYVQVYEQPVANAGADASACGLSYELNATPSVGVGGWSLKVGTGSVSFGDVSLAQTNITVDAYGDYTFIWEEVNNGCVSADEVVISFIEVPVPVVMEDADTCGLVFNLRATASVGVGTWLQITGAGTSVFGDANLPQSNVVVDAPGTYTYIWLENNNGCLAADTVDLEYFPLPESAVGPFDPEQCTPSQMQFTNTSTDADTYLWDFGDGFISSQEDPAHTFTNNTSLPVDHQIKLIASNSYGCVDTGFFDLRVLPAAVARFDNDDEPGCSPLTIEFTNNSERATAYEWSFGDGSSITTDEHTSHTFVNTEHYVQSFEVELVANNTYGCRDTISRFVTVYPLVKYKFNTTPVSGCHPLKADMLADPGAYTYEWDFGDGDVFAGVNAVSHIFENTEATAKDYTIKLVTSSVFGCRDSLEQVVSVLPSPYCAFSLSTLEGCSPLLVDFENNSMGVDKSIWEFGDGQVEEVLGTANTSHSYTNNELAPVTYRPRLVVENSLGCRDSMELYLQVFPKVTAALSEGGAGCTPYFESLLNNSVGANSFTWDFGDGDQSSAFNGHHEYVNATLEDQQFNVQLIAESTFGCSDTAFTNVMVYRRPVPAFNVDPKEMQMPSSTINLANNTAGIGWDYLWDFGDEQTSDLQSPGSHTYGKSGEFDIWLKVKGEHCADSAQQAVMIWPTLPTVDYGPDTIGCPPLEVSFYNNSVDATTYLWDFGDGNISSKKRPTHTYYTSGVYTVTLTVEGPGGIVEDKGVEVVVYDSPTANFEVRPAKVKLPEEVAMVNYSEGATSYLWDFGDGNTSTEHSLQYQYEKAGVYDVTLEVENDKGCTDEFVIRSAVVAEEAGSIRFPNAFTPNPTGPSGGVYIKGSPDNFVFYPLAHEGVEEYQLRIFTRWGEIVFESNDIKIGWDGYHDGKICPPGVYIWKTNTRFSNGLMEVQTGDVTLFR